MDEQKRMEAAVELTRPDASGTTPVIGPDGKRDDTEFRRGLTDLLNRYNKESATNTPDFVLALFLARSLDAFDFALKAKAIWEAKK